MDHEECEDVQEEPNVEQSGYQSQNTWFIDVEMGLRTCRRHKHYHSRKGNFDG